MDRFSPAAEMSAAAAELREQLSLISAASQMLEETAGEQGLSYVASLNAGIHRMLRTVTRLELGHRLAAEHELRLVTATVDLAEWTEELARRMAGVLAGAGVRLEWDLPSRLTARVDPELLTYTLTELIASATLSGRRVKLQLSRSGDDFRFHITAAGDPLVLPLAPRMDDRQEDSPGMIMVRRIVALHGGSVLSCLGEGQPLSCTLLLKRDPMGEGFSLSAPIEPADNGGFDPILVAFSHLLPSSEFRPSL